MEENTSSFEYDLNLAFPTEAFPFMAGLRQRLERELKSLNDRINPRVQPMSIPIGGGAFWGERYYEGFDITALPPRDSVFLVT